jgi:hypothetical protein
MSQPPGSHAPVQYVPPAAFGTPSGAPAHSGRGGRGPIPWLLGGGALLIVGVGALLAALLGGDLRNEPVPGVTAASSAAAIEPVPPATMLAPSTPPADQETGRYDGSGAAALRWIDAMAARDFQAAFELSCAGVQAASVAIAPDGNGASTLGDFFFQHVLGGSSFAAATLVGVRYDPASGTDVATFRLAADDGGSIALAVHVVSDGTVCDFR